MPTYDFIAFYLSSKLSNLILLYFLPLFASTIDADNVSQEQAATHVAGKQHAHHMTCTSLITLYIHCNILEHYCKIFC